MSTHESLLNGAIAVYVGPKSLRSPNFVIAPLIDKSAWIASCIWRSHPFAGCVACVGLCVPAVVSITDLHEFVCAALENPIYDITKLDIILVERNSSHCLWVSYERVPTMAGRTEQLLYWYDPILEPATRHVDAIAFYNSAISQMMSRISVRSAVVLEVLHKEKDPEVL